MKLRKLLVHFFDTYEIAWESFMVGLAIIFVIIGFLPDFLHFPDRGLTILDSIDFGITSFFILEFVTRISISSLRLRYLKEHWLDLVAILPMIRWLKSGTAFPYPEAVPDYPHSEGHPLSGWTGFQSHPVLHAVKNCSWTLLRSPASC
jgi:hypothetical protein